MKAVQGSYIPVQGGYILVQGGYITVQDGYITVQDGFIPKYWPPKTAVTCTSLRPK